MQVQDARELAALIIPRRLRAGLQIITMDCLLFFEKLANFFENDEVRFTATLGGVVVETRRVDKCHMKAILHQEIILRDGYGL